MTLHEIQSAVIAGKAVHWINSRYRVTRDRLDRWLIECDNGSCIGLTHTDGRTLNGRHAEFYIASNPR